MEARNLAPQTAGIEMTKNKQAAPTWFTIVAWTMVVWNLMGLAAFFAQMTMSEAAMSELPEDQQKLYGEIPPWVIVAFAVAVFCGTAGAILLALKNKLSIPVLMLSLVGVLIQNGYMFFGSDTVAVMGAGQMILPAIVVLISIALVPLSLFAKKSNWMN